MSYVEYIIRVHDDDKTTIETDKLSFEQGKNRIKINSLLDGTTEDKALLEAYHTVTSINKLHELLENYIKPS